MGARTGLKDMENVKVLPFAENETPISRSYSPTPIPYIEG
jgi:hypothetical protein